MRRPRSATQPQSAQAISTADNRTDRPTLTFVRDEELVPQQPLDVVVTLQDGRVLDGWLVRYEHVMQCERVVFEPWQIDEVFPQR